MKTVRYALPLLAALTLAAAPDSKRQDTSAPAPTGIVIRGGVLLDGTGTKARRGDVRIVGDTIVAIGKVRAQAGDKIIEARGLDVSPGFIDTHTHADAGLLENPDAATQIRQGITTAIVGQDGGSHLPLKDYFAALNAKHVALNVASFVGHGTLRGAIMGDNYKRPATPDEVAKMAALAEQEMQAGALGLSSGLEYDPGYYSTTEELIALARVASRHGGLYISHVRDEGDEVFKSFQELITIAREAGLPAQISHIKLDTTPVWNKAADALQLIEDANRSGLDISADVYPYPYWQSTAIVLIPTRDWTDRKAWEKGLAEVGGAAHVRFTTYTPDLNWQGKTLDEIAALNGKDAVTTLQEIVAKTHGPNAKGSESVVVTAMTEPDIVKFVHSPRVMFCTDGFLKGTHPRGAGSFPRLLGMYAREQRALTLEQAVHKATQLPAQRLGFTDRGTLAPGQKADVVLFDPKTVRDTATVTEPTAPPIGLPTVLVNGVVVLENGRITGAHPGEVLKRTSDKPRAVLSGYRAAGGNGFARRMNGTYIHHPLPRHHSLPDTDTVFDPCP